MKPAKTLLVFLILLAAIRSLAQTPSRFDVVITEIMADPTPVVGLPNAEYVEIKNVSTTAFNLNGWKISDAASTGTINASFVLQPDSMVILCSTGNVAAFSVYGRTIGVTSFPSLDNAGDMLTLHSAQNKTIHTVAYSNEWYGNEAKKDGGWSLEMIDPKNPCTGKDNWKVSTNSLGGTPGKINSVNGSNLDNTPPQLKRAYMLDTIALVLVFDEPLDSVNATVVSNYSLPGITVASASPLPPLFQNVQLKLATPLPAGTIYNITVSNITDCKGNAIGAFNKTKIGLPQDATALDVVINEILFNPKPSGYDYVEFYNRSNKIVDASNLYIANRNNNGVVSSLKKLSDEPFYLFPGDYVVVTEDKTNLKLNYVVKNGDAVLQLSSLPSFPDDKGNVVLVNLNGDIIDDVVYEDKWQFALIDNAEGVALERIDPNGPSQNKSNWHSAAAPAGYGTPTYQNSQYKQTGNVNATIDVSPKIFSPDNDGRDDITTISYQVETSGYIANVMIFDAGGKLVRHLVKNDLLALKGSWNWDGLGENYNKLSIGTYIIYTEIFNLQGKKQSFKNTVVLARKLN